MLINGKYKEMSSICVPRHRRRRMREMHRMAVQLEEPQERITGRLSAIVNRHANSTLALFFLSFFSPRFYGAIAR